MWVSFQTFFQTFSRNMYTLQLFQHLKLVGQHVWFVYAFYCCSFFFTIVVPHFFGCWHFLQSGLSKLICLFYFWMPLITWTKRGNPVGKLKEVMPEYEQQCAIPFFTSCLACVMNRSPKKVIFVNPPNNVVLVCGICTHTQCFEYYLPNKEKYCEQF